MGRLIDALPGCVRSLYEHDSAGYREHFGANATDAFVGCDRAGIPGWKDIAPVPQPTLGDGDERVQYVGPDTYILRDAQGRPQSMPGMTYEDFLAAWKRLQQVDEADRRPRYAIDRVVIEGRARDRHAELQCEITVRLLTEEPVDVPLGMAEAILQGEARFTTAATSEKSDGDKPRQAPTAIKATIWTMILSEAGLWHDSLRDRANRALCHYRCWFRCYATRRETRYR